MRQKEELLVEHTIYNGEEEKTTPPISQLTLWLFVFQEVLAHQSQASFDQVSSAATLYNLVAQLVGKEKRG